MLGWLLAAVGLYVALCAVMFVAQRNLQYFPNKVVPIPAEVGLPEFRTVTVQTADSLLLSGLHAAPTDGSKPTILYFHGNGGHVGDRSAIAGALHRAGYGVLLAGYRGYGGNPGSPTEQGLMTDGRAWADWLVERGVSGRKLVFYGESLGTGVAVQMAAERNAAGLVLQSPYTSITDVAAAAYPFLPVRLLLLDRFDSLGRIPEIRAPLLVVHGERDSVVPVALGRRLFAAAPEPKTGVWPPQADHMDLLVHGLADTVIDWLDRLDRPRAAGPVTIDQAVARGTALVRK